MLRIQGLKSSSDAVSSLFSSKSDGKKKTQDDETITPNGLPTIAVFNGKNSKLGCDEFIRDVQKAASRFDREDDPVWMAQVAVSALTGPAKTWFEPLDEHTKTNWNYLRPALLRKYPRASLSPNSLFTPASSPPGALNPPPTSAHLEPPSTPPRKVFPPPLDAPWFDPTVPTPAPVSPGLPSARLSDDVDRRRPLPAAPPSPIKAPIADLVSVLGLDKATGVIEVTRAGSILQTPQNLIVHVARHPNGNGWLTTLPAGSSLSAALVVEHVPKWTQGGSVSDGSVLKIKDSVSGVKRPILMQWNHRARNEQDSFSNWANFMLSENNITAGSVGHVREVQWTMQLDGKIIPVWVDDAGEIHNLTLAVYQIGASGRDVLYVVRDFQSFVQAHPVISFYEATLTFKPVAS